MIFKTVRNLKNKVFSTSLVRVPEQDDPCAEIEKVLEDDFGPVEVEAGGKFEAYVTKVEGQKPTYAKPTAEDKDGLLFKFALDPKKIPLVAKAEISYSCDSEKETPRKTEKGLVITPLEIAELKCKIFEETVKERITAAVQDWKAKQTNFETEEKADFEIHLS